MSNAEHHEKLCEILTRLVDVLDSDDLWLLAYSCGVRISDFYGSPEQAAANETIEWKAA